MIRPNGKQAVQRQAGRGVDVFVSRCVQVDIRAGGWAATTNDR